MPKTTALSRASSLRDRRVHPVAAACGCVRCTCADAPRCQCHVFNALVALALRDLRHAVRVSAP